VSGVDLDSTTYVRPLAETDEAVTVLCLHPDEATAAAVVEGLDASNESVTARASSSVPEALDGLGTDAVDCVVCGYSFPDTDGIALLERVRAIDDGLPFVLLTDEGSEQVAAAAVNAGADGYVTYEGSPDEATFTALNDRLETVVDDYRTYQRLDEATDLLFRLTEYTNDALWMFSGDWSETVVINSGYEALWGRSVTDLVDEPSDFLRGVHPDHRESVTEKMTALSDGEPADLEFRVRTDERERTRWVNVHAEPVFDDDGTVAYVAGFSRDISELKRREQRLRELAEATRRLPQARSEREVADVVVDIVDSVIGCPVTAFWSDDADGDALEPTAASESALDVAGVSAVGALAPIEPGHDEMAIYREGEQTLVPDYDALSNPSSPDARLETLVLVPVGDRGLLTVGHSDATTFDEFERTMLEMVEQAAVDALDRVEREDELERHRTELERSNESLQQFAYVASHDLQEPLRMVSSYVSLLDSEYGDDLDDEAAQYMEYAVDGATRMQSMIDALLQYSRVHSRGGDFAAVDAGSVFDETLQSLGLLVEDADASVRRTELPTVSADRSQLGQLFQNLVKNAVHHGGEAPAVTVRAERTDGESSHEADWVRFTVADDGPGIDPSQHDRIFEIFKQNSSRTDSTGIGLAMCKRIVERHGGEIWVESDPGDGAAFHFTLPAPDTDDQERHA